MRNGPRAIFSVALVLALLAAPLPSPGPPFELLPTLFPVNALVTCTDWLWSGVLLRFPHLIGFVGREKVAILRAGQERNGE